MQTRYVNTASSAGGDGTTNLTSGSTRAFATLSEGISTLTGTLSDAYTFYCEGTAADTTGLGTAHWGFVTSATNYVLITTTPANRHDGKWNTGKYRLEVTNTQAIYHSSASHIRMDGIQIQVTVNNGSSYEAIRTTNPGQTVGDIDMRISNCILRGVVTSGSLIGYYAQAHSGTGTSKIWNSIAYDCSNVGFLSDLPSGEFYNCSAVDCGQGFIANVTNGMTCINCLGSGGTCFVAGGSFTASSKNNASTDATAPGTNSRTSQTFTFVNAASDDFHLAESDLGAKDRGFTDPGSGLFLDDIDGTTRLAWDIGADEYPPSTARIGAGPALPGVFQPIMAGFAS